MSNTNSDSYAVPRVRLCGDCCILKSMSGLQGKVKTIFENNRRHFGKYSYTVPSPDTYLVPTVSQDESTVHSA